METGSVMCIPLTCRGLQVLGFPIKDKIYLCVHQLAIELWKAYDTPRVSVQRKILDLGIKIVSSDRSMIRILRAAGIIENFRATMILLRDAEILCDALEFSRKKRGLQKHALQTKHKPGERSTRLEEQRAKKFTAKMNSLYNLAALKSQAVNSVALTKSTKEPQQIIHSDHHSERWAPSGSPPSPCSSIEEEDCVFDTLFVAQDPVVLGGKSCQEVDLKHALSAAQREKSSSKFPSKMGRSKTTLAVPKQSHSSKPKKPANRIHSPNDKWDGDDVYKPLSSPATETSELDDHCSTSEGRSRSRQPSGSITPERFLYLPSSSEEEEYKLLPDKAGKLRSSGKELPSEKPQNLSKRVVATKLRHFAQTTSPKNNVNDPVTRTSHKPSAPSHPHTPAVPNNTASPVVVKRKRGRPPKVKHPRPTALSSFATKKRAMSPSLSPVFDNGDERLKTEGGESGLPLSLKPDDAKNCVPNGQGVQSRAEAMEVADRLPTADLAPHADTGSIDTGSIAEDDIVSVASGSTNSTNSSGQRSSSRATRRTKASEKDPPPVFRFNELFSFYPPRLVVRDGELVPEHSLSVKKLDKNSVASLPESHPFLSWTLGCPVSGKGSRNGRKRKAPS